MSEIKNEINEYQGLLTLIEKTAINVDGVVNAVGYIKDKIDKQEEFNVNIDERMIQIEENEEITTEQCNELQIAVKRKVSTLLEDDEKYLLPSVYSNCWHYLKRNGCGHKYPKTKKRNYSQVIEALKNYSPDINVIKSNYMKEQRIKFEIEEELRHESNKKR